MNKWADCTDLQFVTRLIECIDWLRTLKFGDVMSEEIEAKLDAIRVEADRRFK